MANITRILEHKSDKTHYHAHCAVSQCIDNRFYAAKKKHMKALSFTENDIIKLAGGAMSLADRTRDGYHNLLKQMITSLTLHKPEYVVLTVHVNCGAYKPLLVAAGIDPDAESQEEVDFLVAELFQAKRNLSQDLLMKGFTPEIRMYIYDFDGVLEIDSTIEQFNFSQTKTVPIEAN